MRTPQHISLDVVQANIFYFLQPKELRCRASLVCKSWHKLLLEDGEFWQHYLPRAVPSILIIQAQTSSKTLYQAWKRQNKFFKSLSKAQHDKPVLFSNLGGYIVETILFKYPNAAKHYESLPCNEYVISADWGGHMFVWDTIAQCKVYEMPNVHTNRIRALCADSVKPIVYSGGTDGIIVAWDMCSMEYKIVSTNIKFPNNDIISLLERGNRLYSGNNSGHVTVYDSTTMQELVTCKTMGDNIWSFNLYGNNLYATVHNTLFRFDTSANMQFIDSKILHKAYIRRTVITNYPKPMLITGCADASLHVYELPSMQLIHTMSLPKSVQSLFICDKYCIIGDQASVITVLDLQTFQSNQFKYGASWVNAITVHGVRLIAGGGDSCVRMFDFA